MKKMELEMELERANKSLDKHAGFEWPEDCDHYCTFCSNFNCDGMYIKGSLMLKEMVLEELVRREARGFGIDPNDAVYGVQIACKVFYFEDDDLSFAKDDIISFQQEELQELIDEANEFGLTSWEDDGYYEVPERFEMYVNEEESDYGYGLCGTRRYW